MEKEKAMLIRHTDGKNKDFIELCRLLDDNLNEIIGGAKQREQYNQYNTLEDIHDVVLIYIDGIVVGCASFKKYEKKIAEIKRVFIRKEFRGKGMSNKLMDEIEQKARNKGFTKLILETGKSLVEAMGLYKKRGYKVVENYGQYKDMRCSICMEKRLDK